jgi:hypothetical protein
MLRARRALAAAVALVSAALAVAGSAPAQTSEAGDAPTLRVDANNFGLTWLDLSLRAGPATQSASMVAFRVPKGYVFRPRRPVGTTAGLVFAVRRGSDDAEASLAVADSAAPAGDPAAQTCDPGPHLAVLVESAIAKQAAPPPLIVFVDAAGGDPSSAYVVQVCPAIPIGEQTPELIVALAGNVLVAPAAPAVYTWSALVTPPLASGSGPDPATTFELRADVPIPQTFTFDATYDAATKQAVLAGRYTRLGRPEHGVPVSFAVRSKHVHLSSLGPARTGADGRFTYRWPVEETTQFTASIDSSPARACDGVSAAPGGCLNTTTTGPGEVAAQVRFPAADAPRFAPSLAGSRLAARIDLQRSDLPGGWDAVPGQPPLAGRCAGFNPNESDLTETGTHAGWFATEALVGGASAQAAASETTVFATGAQAATYFAREAMAGRTLCQAKEARADGWVLAALDHLRIPKLARGSIEYRLRLRLRGYEFFSDQIALLGARSVTFVTFLRQGAPPTLGRTAATKIAARAIRG